jgi:hypothetical protein
LEYLQLQFRRSHVLLIDLIEIYMLVKAWRHLSRGVEGKMIRWPRTNHFEIPMKSLFVLPTMNAYKKR